MKNLTIALTIALLTICNVFGQTPAEKRTLKNTQILLKVVNTQTAQVQTNADFEKRLKALEALPVGSGSAAVAPVVLDTTAIRAFLAAEIKKLGGVVTASDLDSIQAAWYREGHRRHFLSMKGAYNPGNGKKLIVEELEAADGNAQTTADDALNLANANNGNILDIELTLTDAPLDSSLASAQLRKEAQERLNQNVELKLQQLLSSSNRPAIVVQ